MKEFIYTESLQLSTYIWWLINLVGLLYSLECNQDHSLFLLRWTNCIIWNMSLQIKFKPFKISIELNILNDLIQLLLF